jgi:hypothetical protein
VAAYGGPQFQVTQQVMSRWAEAVQASKVDVVLQVVLSGGGGSATSSSMMEGLLTLLLSEKVGVEESGSRQREPNPQADQLRAQILESLKESRQGAPGPVPPASPPAGPPEGKPA